MWNSPRGLPTVIIGCCLSLASCDRQIPAWNAGKLVVIVPEMTQGAEAEFERELVQLFAKQLHASVEMLPLQPDVVRSELREHRAHLAAATLRSEPDLTTLRFGPSYQSVREWLVCNRNKPNPKLLAIAALRKLAAVPGSAQEVALREAQVTLPSLRWQADPKLSSKNLLAEVSAGTLDCVAANELQLAEARNYHPNLIATLEIAAPSQLAWAFPTDADPELLNQVKIFFDGIRQDGTLLRLLDRYYGHNNRLDKMDAVAFIARIKTVLPRYRRLFEEAAALTGEDWRLLAALAYQESQWDPLATSYTNVRGMMMLTEDTADQMKVDNRLDARESILAGAKYLALLKDQLPSRIPEPDRTWLALAAYNQGSSHLEDARILTERAGLNPDSWSNIKKWMPVLNQPEFYRTLKHGYARGGEAVILVESIRNYHDMLKRLEPDPALAVYSAPSYRLIGRIKQFLR